MAQTADDVFDEILATFQARGGQHYGENVTELEHALQSAASAEKVNADPNVVVACLLHDYGHLVHNLGEDVARTGVDARHEELGAELLKVYFPDEVVEPARLHVAAKRYLCARRPEYLAGLSEASKLSLQLQGGPMSVEDALAFEANPHYKAAVELRHHDDAAKVEGAATKTLEDYRALVTRFIRLPM